MFFLTLFQEIVEQTVEDKRKVSYVSNCSIIWVCVMFTLAQDSITMLFSAREIYLKVGWPNLRMKGISMHLIMLKIARQFKLGALPQKCLAPVRKVQ